MRASRCVAQLGRSNPEPGIMRLRLGQPVHATDGAFGSLADIVIDPVAATVTHIVVAPTQRHQQTRLVPIWLVSVDDANIVNVALAASFIRQLQRVACQDFVQVKGRLDLGDTWDVGREDLIARPYWDIGDFGDSGALALDRSGHMAKGECEIRRRSEVTTSDFYLVGHVEGFVASGNHLVACVVQIGLPGLRHYKMVPMGLVAQVFDAEIILTMDKHDFEQLPTGAGLKPHGRSSIETTDWRVKRAADGLRDSANRLAARTKHRYHRTSPHDAVKEKH